MMFIDASALVAILTREDDWQTLSTRVQQAETPVTSAIAIYEASLAIALKMAMPHDEALREVEQFMRSSLIDVVPIGSVEARLAIDAHARFGRMHHKAALNMGDCFAYACAKLSGAELLYKGEDFAKTDLA